jgi:lipopolysaccharide biosynthesis glycosyltransferase
MAEYLKKHKYKQIMAVDGGDIIFQGDISELFRMEPDKIKACQEDLGAPFEDFFIDNYFIKSEEKKIKNTIKNKKMINAGMIVGPHKLMIKLAKEIDRILINKNEFGPEQIAVNYILYKNGFVPLDKTWNFVVTASENKFKIVNGEFYFPNGEKIKIVHNAGMTYIFRPIKNFGYGKGNNELKLPVYNLLRLTFKSYRKISKLIKESLNKKQ